LARSGRTLWLVSGLGAALLVAAGYVWMRRTSGAILAEAKRNFEQGKTLRQSLAANTCLDTFFVHHAANPSGSMSHEVNEEVFLEGCLRTSTPTAFCDTVPQTTTVSGLVRFAAWSADQCRLHALADESCPHALKAVMHYCDKRRHP
jgi:hypothetical protein